jgi:hypothetical protein
MSYEHLACARLTPPTRSFREPPQPDRDDSVREVSPLTGELTAPCMAKRLLSPEDHGVASSRLTWRNDDLMTHRPAGKARRSTDD